MIQPPITGLDDWYPEDEYEDEYEETPFPVEEDIYRVIDQYGNLDGRNRYYTTLKGAKTFLAGCYSHPNSRIQKGKVIWSELD